MRKRCVLLILVLAFLCSACTVVNQAEDRPVLSEATERELRSYANEYNTWVLCYKQGTRTSNYTRCDATNQNLYFSYTVHNCVDVYDMEGTFLYSILFPYRQNGVIYVRCDDTQAYIRDKFGSVYIFEGNKIVKTMNKETADLQGINSYWFYDHVSGITVDRQWITIREGSQTTHQIRTPAKVSRSTPAPVSAENLQGLVVLSAAAFVFLVIAYCVAFRKRKNE